MTDKIGCISDQLTVMETYSGRFVDSIDIKKEDISFVDIVHSLANTCRYGGHCKIFYSVAEHSIYCHDEAVRRGLPFQVCAAALLHDGGEAYWHDLGRPLKNAEKMKGYLEYLDKAQGVVEFAASPLVHEAAMGWLAEIKSIDNGVLKTEVLRLMKSKGAGWGFLCAIDAVRIPWWKWLWYRIPGMAKRGFLKRLRSYGYGVVPNIPHKFGPPRPRPKCKPRPKVESKGVTVMPRPDADSTRAYLGHVDETKGCFGSQQTDKILDEIEKKLKHNRPSFVDIVEELIEMQDRKGQDYGTNEDTLANLKASEMFGVPAWQGTIIRANDKMNRIASFIRKGRLENEPVEDSLLDLAVYAIHALRLYREDNIKDLPDPDMVKKSLQAIGEGATEKIEDVLDELEDKLGIEK